MADIAMLPKQKLKKGLMFTDIHLGKKSNSQTHLEHCFNFIQWVCDQVKKDPSIDHILFLGDWMESRSAIHILTLHYSELAIQILSLLGIPVFFMIGNHDMLQKYNRKIHSMSWIQSYDNIYLIDEPTVVDQLGANGALLCPYLVEDEYAALSEFSNVPVWFGHFEFQGFVLTGYSHRMEHGPSHKLFKKVKRIFSGHYHKRQVLDNAMYIGNTFPMDYSDANDDQRGITFYEYASDDISHMAWPDAPYYQNVKLSKLIEGDVDIRAGATVKCVIDVALTYEESTKLRGDFKDQYQLIDLVFEETSVDVEEVQSTDEVVSMDGTVDERICALIGTIDVVDINVATLTAIYKEIPRD